MQNFKNIIRVINITTGVKSENLSHLILGSFFSFPFEIEN